MITQRPLFIGVFNEKSFYSSKGRGTLGHLVTGVRDLRCEEASQATWDDPTIGRTLNDDRGGGLAKSGTAIPIVTSRVEDPMEELPAVLESLPNFFADVIESLSEGLIITDRDHRILYVNRSVEAITGHPRDEIVGRVSHETLVPPEQWPLMLHRLRERRSGKAEEYELEIIRRDRTRIWVSVRAVPFRDAQGNICGTIGAIRDISERRRLEGENAYLHEELKRDCPFREFVGTSAAVRRMLEQVAVVGPTDAPVLITGESGTGKELVARAIHASSLRNQRPLIRVNCAAISSDLFESEFFGHVRGAFTGAIKSRMGRFELADGGTLLLDELGEIPLNLQGKLLRVLQEGQFEAVGSDETKRVDVRVVAATNRDLEKEVERGMFRQDLYFRLNVFPIGVPALRHRLEDIELLAPHFVEIAAKKLGIPTPKITKKDISILCGYGWPGNVRELQHVLERAVILSRNRRLQLDIAGRTTQPEKPSGPPSLPTGNNTLEYTLRDLKQLEKKILLGHLEAKNWKIYGPRGAAESLGIKPTTLVSKMKRFGIEKPT